MPVICEAVWLFWVTLMDLYYNLQCAVRDRWWASPQNTSMSSSWAVTWTADWIKAESAGWTLIENGGQAPMGSDVRHAREGNPGGRHDTAQCYSHSMDKPCEDRTDKGFGSSEPLELPDDSWGLPEAWRIRSNLNRGFYSDIRSIFSSREDSQMNKCS